MYRVVGAEFIHIVLTFLTGRFDDNGHFTDSGIIEFHRGQIPEEKQNKIDLVLGFLLASVFEMADRQTFEPFVDICYKARDVKSMSYNVTGLGVEFIVRYMIDGKKEIVRTFVPSLLLSHGTIELPNELHDIPEVVNQY